MRISRKLAETSSFIPQLIRIADGSYTVRWIPAVMDQRVDEIFRSLSAAFPSPEEHRAEEPRAEAPSTALKSEQLRSLVAYFLGQFVQHSVNSKNVKEDPVYRIFIETFAHPLPEDPCRHGSKGR